MTLRKQAETVNTVRLPGPPCAIHRLRLQLDRDDNLWLDEVLPPSSGRKSSWIAEVLRADGHQVSNLTVQRHRRRECACDSRV